MKKDFSVSMVSPVFNGGEILSSTINTLTSYLKDTYQEYEVLFINDASTDSTATILRTAAQKNARIKVITNPINMGQQLSLLSGLLATQYSIVLSVDADVPCELDDLSRIAELTHLRFELVVSRRVGRKTQKWWRALGSWGANLLFRLLFRFQIRDFGSGVAGLRRSLIEKLRTQKNKIHLLKIDALQLAQNYAELDIASLERSSESKSSYSFRKLWRLFWAIFIYRFR